MNCPLLCEDLIEETELDLANHSEWIRVERDPALCDYPLTRSLSTLTRQKPDKAQNVLQRIIRVFAETFVSHDRHTLFALEESGPPWTTYTCESQ
jgi:hypothetical protein